jgi:hypothetical protein
MPEREEQNENTAETSPQVGSQEILRGQSAVSDPGDNDFLPPAPGIDTNLLMKS